MRDTRNSGNQVEMLKPSDIAPRLGVTTGRVYQLIAEGLIPSVRIGRPYESQEKLGTSGLRNSIGVPSRPSSADHGPITATRRSIRLGRDSVP